MVTTDAGLSPAETTATANWAGFGQPLPEPGELWMPAADDRALPSPFTAAAASAWPMSFDREQSRSLILGHRSTEMEDKWNVLASPVTAEGTTTVTFYRSWTGTRVVELELQLDASGSRVIRALWESAAGAIKDPGEEFARGQFLLVFQYTLGNSRPPSEPKKVVPGRVEGLLADRELSLGARLKKLFQR
jgi:hypothetical protein